MSREIAEIRNEVKSWKAIQVSGAKSAFRSPSNIALLKYWGKRPNQLPANPSLSFSLSKAYTTTYFNAAFRPASPGISGINNNPDHPFLKKIQPFWQFLLQEIPLLNAFQIDIKTENTFPHGAGIASSASGFSALALAILDIAQTLSGSSLQQDEFLKYASSLARMGSGSAARSVYPGFTVWGASTEYTGSSDLFAIDINALIHPEFRNLQDTILLVSASEKSLSSTHGHGLMNGHPFADGRISQALSNLSLFHKALGEGDFDLLANLSENEALSLHALIMSSAGGHILLEPDSLDLIRRIRIARNHGLPVFFTIDAGPNIHLIYSESVKEKALAFIHADLSDICPENKIIFDSVGSGPVKLNEFS